MKKYRLIGLLALLASLSAAVNATLIDRGNGMIYDTVQDITWLADANYAQTSGFSKDGAMTWQQALDWTAQLSFGGFNDWRLFDAAPDDPNCSERFQTISFGAENYGFNCTANELGHLFYNEFGLTVGQSIFTAAGNAGFDLFSNVQDFWYWSGTDFPRLTNNAWFFDTQGGYQGGDRQESRFHVWAVRDGDVATASVPEPSTLALFAFTGILLLKRRITYQLK